MEEMSGNVVSCYEGAKASLTFTIPNTLTDRPVRLAGEQRKAGQRRLEVWSATRDTWLPVCGAHWSAMPMSHEACQALGYSRANTTLLVLETPVLHSNLSTLITRLRGNSSSSHIPKNLAPDDPFQASKVRFHSRSFSPGAWFDFVTGNRLKSDEEVAGGVGERLASVIEGLAAAVKSTTTLGTRADHVVTYELRSGDKVVEFDDLIWNDVRFNSAALSTKLNTITSLLYYGPEAGCIHRSDQFVASVYLQCENFQCGRSITSHSARIRLRRNSEPVSRANREAGQLNASSVHQLTSITADGGSLRFADSKEKREPKLEATEELNPFIQQDFDSSDTANIASGPHENVSDSRYGEVLPEPRAALASSRMVVGGTESMPGEFPYLAALHGGPDEVFFCGGVLISINWLVTAAHCVGNRTQPDGWTVKVGITRRIASPAYVKKLRVRYIVKHPHFNKDSLFNNDIALILLEESVEFNQYLRPICLPRANLILGPESSKDCVVVGFGKSKFSQEASYLHVAHFVNVPIVRHSVCSNWYAEHGVNLTEGMLCAGYAEGKRDACQVGFSSSSVIYIHSASSTNNTLFREIPGQGCSAGIRTRVNSLWPELLALESSVRQRGCRECTHRCHHMWIGLNRLAANSVFRFENLHQRFLVVFFIINCNTDLRIRRRRVD